MLDHLLIINNLDRWCCFKIWKNASQICEPFFINFQIIPKTKEHCRWRSFTTVMLKCNWSILLIICDFYSLHIYYFQFSLFYNHTWIAAISSNMYLHRIPCKLGSLPIIVYWLFGINSDWALKVFHPLIYLSSLYTHLWFFKPSNLSSRPV